MATYDLWGPVHCTVYSVQVAYIFVAGGGKQTDEQIAIRGSPAPKMPQHYSTVH